MLLKVVIAQVEGPSRVIRYSGDLLWSIQGHCIITSFEDWNSMNNSHSTFLYRGALPWAKSEWFYQAELFVFAGLSSWNWIEPERKVFSIQQSFSVKQEGKSGNAARGEIIMKRKWDFLVFHASWKRLGRFIKFIK